MIYMCVCVCVCDKIKLMIYIGKERYNSSASFVILRMLVVVRKNVVSIEVRLTLKHNNLTHMVTNSYSPSYNTD